VAHIKISRWWWNQSIDNVWIIFAHFRLQITIF